MRFRSLSLAVTLGLLLPGCGETLHFSFGDASSDVSDASTGVDAAVPPLDGGSSSPPEETVPDAAAPDAIAPCPDGAWEASDACIPWSSCAAGTRVAADPSSTADRVCVACGPNETSVGTNATSCHPSAIAIASGAAHTCIVVADETVRCWGWDGWGQLAASEADNHSLPVVAVGVSHATTLVAGTQHTCALLDDGTVTCWGKIQDGYGLPPTKIAGLSGVEALSAGSEHTCALMLDGTVQCWGYNFYGQLGDGTDISRPTPAPVANVSDAVGIASGPLHNCAIRRDGSAICWGTGSFGELGDGTTEGIRATPKASVALGGISAMALGADFSCAQRTDRSVFCWGRNQSGQLGSLLPAVSLSPVAVTPLLSTVRLAAGRGDVCAVMEDGSAVCWGTNATGQLGYAGPLRTPLAPVNGLTGATQLAPGTNHACAVTDGNVLCWGDNTYGQLGDGTNTARSSAASIRW